VAKLAKSPYALRRGKAPWLKVLNPEYFRRKKPDGASIVP
jgi:hypothetical protein